MTPISVRPTRLILSTLAMLLVATAPRSMAQASDAGAPAVRFPANMTLTGRILKTSTFQTNSSGVNTNCGSSGCQATKALFPTANPICTGPIGQTCTIYILLETSNQISASDQGLYRFLVDGKNPEPGPSDSTGFYKFVESDPNSDATHSGSHAVVATVMNSSVNQNHPVAISYGCKDDTGDGCFAFAARSALRIDVFQP
jgi:hypothetical protein